MRYLILLFFVQVCYVAIAQKHIQYSGSLEGGILKGNTTSSSFVFTTQGIAYRQFALGIGTGFDRYAFHSVPVFIDVKRTFSNNKIQPFLQAATGINFTNVHSEDAKSYLKYAGDGHFDKGLFIKGGGGLLFRAQKRIKYSLAVGYTYKTTAFTYTPITGNPWTWQMEPIKDIFHYNRWYAGVGIWW